MGDVLPPDGVAWPPEPPRRVAPSAADPLSGVPSVPAAADPSVGPAPDWRQLAHEQRPDGYAGTAGAPVELARTEWYGVVALGCAALGWASWLGDPFHALRFVLWPMGIGFGVAGFLRARHVPSLYAPVGKAMWIGLAAIVVSVGGLLLWYVNSVVGPTR
jgi:hypothetical protein